MSIIDTTKVIYELAKKGATIELQKRVVELREEAIELQQENLNLKKENLKLKEKIELKEKLKFRRRVYFQVNDEIPFCPYCFEKSNLLFYLSGPRKGQGDEQFYFCCECNITYRTVGEKDFTIWDRRRQK